MTNIAPRQVAMPKAQTAARPIYNADIHPLSTLFWRETAKFGGYVQETIVAALRHSLAARLSTSPAWLTAKS
jgi:hypothetical protein